jgi:hypothetical protein
LDPASTPGSTISMISDDTADSRASASIAFGAVADSENTVAAVRSMAAASRSVARMASEAVRDPVDALWRLAVTRFAGRRPAVTLGHRRRAVISERQRPAATSEAEQLPVSADPQEEGFTAVAAGASGAEAVAVMPEAGMAADIAKR